MKSNSLALLVLTAFTSLNAQNFNYKSIPEKKVTYDYLSFYNNNYVFEAEDKTLFFVDSKDFTKTRSVKLDYEEYIDLSSCNYVDGKILHVSTSSKYENDEEIKANNYRSNQVVLNTFDLETGKSIKSEKFLFNHYKYSLVCDVDTAAKKIIIGVTDSVIKVYNFDLTESSKEGIKMKTKSFDLTAILDFLKSFNSGTKSYTISLDGFGSKDTSSHFTKSYNIKYVSHSDDKIMVVGKYYTAMKVKLKDGQAEFELDVPSEKKVINFDYQELDNGNLILYGKYLEEQGDMKYFGYFSTVINNKLSVVHGLKYFEITKINSAYGNFPNQKYTGLAYCNVASPDFSFYFKEEKVRVMTFQKYYTNLVDHIYIVKLQDDGEIIINMIVNQANNEIKRKYLNNGYAALQVNGKIHFLFYEHVMNISNAVYDASNFEVVNIEKKQTVLAACSYEVGADNFSSKTTVADKVSIPFYLNLDNGDVHYNSENDSYMFIVQGMDKKGNNKNLYFFNYTN